MFEGFKSRRIPVEGGEIAVRIAGSGPPLLLLHGYPQTSAMWHRMAPDLARTHTVVAADLRGYGASWKPEPRADHAAMSKRAMAGDMVQVMETLGHERFLIGAHDRGARVGHRLASDRPERVRALATLDIAPTREMYVEGRSPFAHTYWHWYWLTLPAPRPERMIGADPDAFWLETCGSGSAGLGIFSAEARAEYLAAFRDPACIACCCEDYRAAASIDLRHDDAETGKIDTPLLALWGRDGAIEKHFDCLDLWRRRASDVRGKALPGGHYLAEEVPDAVLAEWLPFFADAPE